MSKLFITVLNMSITASFAALIIIFARMLLRKSPKIFSYALWAVVWFRLICPVSFESALSLLPGQNLMFYNVDTLANPNALSEQYGAGSAVKQTLESTLTAVNTSSNANLIDTAVKIAAAVWILGIAIILCHSTISYLKLRNRISTATFYKDNIFETDQIHTPFVLGLMRPRIYIPTGLEQKELDYILKHEQIHIKRRDYVIKPIAFFTVVLHWFNPIVWISYFLMSKDMEMSCDEEVIRQSKEDIRVSYSRSLLSLSMKQSGLLAPLAFGESNIKTRIKNIINYKKPALWAICPACILVVAISMALAANPSDKIEYLASAEKFLEYKTDYVGDASKVGNIISLLDFPENVNYSYFELHTENVPYGITVHLNTDAKTRNKYTGAINQTPFEKNAIIMFSLIGNVDYINFNLTDGQNDYLIQYTKDQADAMVGKDVREFSLDKKTFAQLLKIGDKIEESFINENKNSSITTIGGADGPLKMYETDKVDKSEQIVAFAWEVINKDIAYYEENPEVKIIDSKITRLERIESFDDLTDKTIDVYALEYRLLPEDLSKVVLAGGMDVDDDGWLKETSSMGSPLLVVSRDDDSIEFIGIVMTGTAVEEGSLKTAVRELLEKNQ
ncbi:M56 family metallopeptidase [Tepidanaerobacter syntrophicus]|uniref:Signal transducer regulating beta-lactamase production n=1 Tax=Tepidanaerobacter syntrophicus TaxID=224999 RepID=A0A0U9I561_9FIRM|nr:M56 family metallopeptidase [Tepidanaerobacter syntrophicus]GAQ25624.1 signal transducer regulating beta-lactamase production [Tepidanaerobacter syntrophicus]